MIKVTFAALISLFVISVFSCNSQGKTDAEKQAGDITSMVQANSSGYTSTSEEYYVKAKINGKDWAADELLVNDGGGIVGQTKGGEHFTLPFELRYARDGEITNFKNHAVDIYMNDDIKMWGGHQGEMMFTKVGGNYAEGKFYLTGTATGSDKQLVVTDGVFRIPITGK
ncbi:MAG: hypothetical protein ABI168_04875 [Ginsengibacter sp.]